MNYKKKYLKYKIKYLLAKKIYGGMPPKPMELTPTNNTPDTEEAPVPSAARVTQKYLDFTRAAMELTPQKEESNKRTAELSPKDFKNPKKKLIVEAAPAAPEEAAGSEPAEEAAGSEPVVDAAEPPAAEPSAKVVAEPSTPSAKVPAESESPLLDEPLTPKDHHERIERMQGTQNTN